MQGGIKGAGGRGRGGALQICSNKIEIMAKYVNVTTKVQRAISNDSSKTRNTKYRKGA